jgi:hypothetical protein
MREVRVRVKVWVKVRDRNRIRVKYIVKDIVKVTGYFPLSLSLSLSH